MEIDPYHRYGINYSFSSNKLISIQFEGGGGGGGGEKNICFNIKFNHALDSNHFAKSFIFVFCTHHYITPLNWN